MTAKSDFTPDEWHLLLEAPVTAGILVATAASGGTFRETFALAHAYTDAHEAHGQGELLGEILAEKPKFDRHRFPSTEALREQGPKEVAAAVALLRTKATADELAAYQEFVLAVAARVAAAHKEHGEEVSASEQAAIDELRAQLETRS
jgi:hypothetical protein